MRPRYKMLPYRPFRISNAIFVIAMLLTPVHIPAARRAGSVQADQYLQHVKFLASPELEGRGAGTQGLERASVYIADRFKEFGLQPAGEAGSYFQAFTLTTGAKPGAGNLLEVNSGNQKSVLELNKSFMPVSFSANGEANAPVVFAGYGITASDFHYDDYAGLDVKDKIVMVLRYEPRSFRKDPNSKERSFTHHSHLISKAINARDHGAKALILVNGEVEQDKLIRFGTVAGPENAGILMAQVTNSVADQWLKSSGKTLAELQKKIDSSGAAASLALPATLRVSLKVDIERQKAPVRNVIGYLPGKSKEYLIIGAHYDHLGRGNESSLAPSQIGNVHPGADDNASGTAGLIELARTLSAERGQLKRGVLFMAFAGEEIGLLGSAEWVKQPTRPLGDAIAMLNMDMIGRVKASKLYIGGAGSGSSFGSILKEVEKGYDFKVEPNQEGGSASDHASFTAKSIPSLFFFSGLHGDYHRPSDTWDKITAGESAQLVNFVADVANSLIAADARPQFAKVAEPRSHSGGGGGGYGPYFGSVPDFAPVEKGVKFADVRAESPAAKAGLKGGDILIHFGDKPINNLHDFTFALRNSKVGDVVKVKILRDGKVLELPVTLEARQ